MKSPHLSGKLLMLKNNFVVQDFVKTQAVAVENATAKGPTRNENEAAAMGVLDPEFDDFNRALILRSVGLNARARKRAATALFLSLYLYHSHRAKSAEAGRGIVLWDEVMAAQRSLAR